ncbi:MAG: sulfatase-like hydrolase/transferase [Dehalococcoidia bacterium]
MTFNTLVIMSDEHNRAIAGCYGNEIASTPNIDALAARGTNFTNAYCNSPICVPSRASFQTGLYVHDIGFWDNAMPYDGSVQGWGHALQAAERPVVSIGKLHYRRAGDPYGFDEEIAPIYVKDGIGDLTTLLRKEPMERAGMEKMSSEAGAGDSPYWAFDSGVAERAGNWLKSKGTADGPPWTLFVSFVMPHFPLLAPEQFFRLYEDAAIPPPKLRDTYVPENRTMAVLREVLSYDRHFHDEAAVRRAVAGYYGIVSALDHNVGRVLAALEEAGLGETTRVIYTSDHGDNVGARGYWGKSTMWEESVGVPMIMAGPDIASGTKCTTPVSLVDLHSTIIDWADVPDVSDGRQRPGRSLTDIALGVDADRAVFSEYHAVGSATGIFMIRKDRWKLIECVGDTPILYDLHSDPEELTNLAADPAYAEILKACREELSDIVDPAAATARAFDEQAKMVERVGGEEVIRASSPIPYTIPPTLG